MKKRLSSEDAAAANRSGRWKNQMRRAAHNGCCRRAAQMRALSSVLWKLLVSEELVGVLISIEIPLVRAHKAVICDQHSKSYHILCLIHVYTCENLKHSNICLTSLEDGCSENILCIQVT